jgi:hypothetical protein
MKLVKFVAPVCLFALPLPCDGAAAAEQATPARQSSGCGTLTDNRNLVALEELALADRQLGAGEGQVGDLFDEDIVLFAVPVPGFAVGKKQALEHLEKGLGAPAESLRSTVVRTGISADCQHGFTFGYAETDATENKPLRKYVAYWVHRPQGWRVALFKLVPREPGAKLGELAPSVPNFTLWAKATAQETAKIKASLAAREKSFSDEAQRIGLGPAFEKFGSADSANVGGGAEFVIGNKAIGEYHGTGPSPLNWAADKGVLIAPSGDLGVTWGMLHRNGPTPPGRLAEIPFFTIWRRASPSQPWLYVAE